MKTLFVLAVSATVILIGCSSGGSAAPPPVPDTSPQLISGIDPFGPDRDCGDFNSHRRAQDFYEAAGGPASDPHRLDADRDGIACEALR